MDEARILQGEDLLSPGFQLLGRRAAGIGCYIERPAEMLPRMPQPDAQAVEGADALIERADIAKLRVERRGGFRRPALQASADLAGQPGLALRATANHHGIGARGLERGERLLVGCDVAIDDERNGDRFAPRADRVPIGLALVKLASGAAVHGDELDAGG